MMAKQYTQSEIHYLIENYGKIPVEEIAKTLGRSKFVIYGMAHKWHLSKPNYTPDKVTVKESRLIYPYKKISK
jgi:hypothetical protein